jgi:hypothetical protein
MRQDAGARVNRWIRHLHYADRQLYALQCFYCIVDSAPLPEYQRYKLTRTGTGRAEYRKSEEIRRKVLALCFDKEA